MTKPKEHKISLIRQFQNHLIAGILTVIPIWITFLLIKFLLDVLARTGGPFVVALGKAAGRYSETAGMWLTHPMFQSSLAVMIVITFLWAVGYTAKWVIGRKLINLFEWFIERIPFVQTIYGAVKKLMSALQQKPDSVQRVVLIDFPSPEMKTVGFVTRTLEDQDTGRKLAAVYVPTTPNPTSGYLEIVPIDKVISTNWTFEEAMSFIISGGAVAPEKMNYSKSFESPAELAEDVEEKMEEQQPGQNSMKKEMPGEAT
jgi:uncharacterized membrane protein